MLNFIRRLWENLRYRGSQFVQGNLVARDPEDTLSFLHIWGFQPVYCTDDNGRAEPIHNRVGLWCDADDRIWTFEVGPICSLGPEGLPAIPFKIQDRVWFTGQVGPFFVIDARNQCWINDTNDLVMYPVGPRVLLDKLSPHEEAWVKASDLLGVQRLPFRETG